jgi:predicted ATPase/serine/threonine protein kinase/signal transduction histidine kinase
VRPLGHGGTAQVYLGHDTVLDRSVALKFAPGERNSEHDFFVEARALARLSHPNIVAVFRVGEVEGRPFLVYELVEGESLDQLEAPLPWRRALAIASSVASGLMAAHAGGILHRDIKPANVMVARDGVVKLIDFGLAQLEGDASVRPQTRSGTPQFMAPEIGEGRRASAQSDIYAFGMLLYWLCAGRLPIPATTVPSTSAPRQEHTLPPVPTQVPDELVAVIRRCTQPDPRDRFASAAELHQQLEALLLASLGIEPPAPREGNVTDGVTDLILIHEGTRFAVFRGRRNGRTVVVKSPRRGSPDPRSDRQLRHEYRLLDTLDLPGVVKPLAYETIAGQPALVLEDAGPMTLADALHGRALEIDAFLELAVEMAAILVGVHDRRVVHGDLCPANFVVGGEHLITLIDFGLASTVTGAAQPPGSVEATLAYLAPEQTGRMKRVVDHRADLYSLGAIFYEMLVGAPPFPFADPLAVVHGHLALMPTAPAAARATVPALLSELVLKLLAKMPEWRYQSAQALHADLEEALQKWRSTGALTAIELGRLDRRELHLPARLYGREAELARLAAALADTVAGANQLFIVEGTSGIGKTALLDAVRALSPAPGRVAVARCDPMTASVPFASVAEAFRTLKDLPSELAQLVAKDLAPDEISVGEAADRVERALWSLVRALAGQGAPLTLMLDDVQWIDPASLKLLCALVADRDLHHLLIVVGWRGEEASANQHVAEEIRAPRRAGARVQELAVGPIDASAVAALLGDALDCSAHRAWPLAEVTMRKTGGNPLFIQRFVRSLHESGLLTFDVGVERWTWDVPRIAETPTPNNIVDLLIASIRRLPHKTQEALQVAACIGAQFDVVLVGNVLAVDVEELAHTLRTATREVLVVPVEATPATGTLPPPRECRFVHDRVRQAALALLPDERKSALHLAIGKHLIEATSESATATTFFAAVDHLNHAAALLTSEAERMQLIERNEKAASLARSATSNRSALAYLQQAIALLPADAWQCHHALAFGLYRDATQVAAISAGPQEAMALALVALDQELSRFERATLYSCMADVNYQRLDYQPTDLARASDWGELAIGLFGLKIPPPAELPGALAEAHAVVETLLGRQKLEELLDAPLANDPEMLVLQNALLDMSGTKFLSQEYYAAGLCDLWALRLTLQHGRTHLSPLAYFHFAATRAMVGDYARSRVLASLALELARRVGDPRIEGFVLGGLAATTTPFLAPLREAPSLLRASVECLVKARAPRPALIYRTQLIVTQWHLGHELNRLAQPVEEALEHARDVGDTHCYNELRSYRQAIRCLRGWTVRPGSFDDAEFDEASFLVTTGQHALWDHRSLRLQVLYLMRDLPAALACMEVLESSWQHVPFVFFRHLFAPFAALTLAAVADAAPSEGKAPLIARMVQFEEALQRWSEACPDNFRHRHALVAAERARVEGRHADAETLYKVAITAAERQGFTNHLAVAEECMGRYFLALEQRNVAAQHLNAAIDAYTRWGATAKARQLDDELLALAIPTARHPLTPSVKTSHEAALDVRTLLKAAETLAGEVVLERLFEKMMRICVEAAGAQRAALVLEEEGAPVVRALAGTSGEITLVQVPLAAQPDLPLSLIEHVRRGGDIVVLGQAAEEGDFVADPDIARRNVKSIMTVPIRRGQRLVGVFYFENNLASDAFHPERVRLFELLSTQIAISLENGQLYAERAHAEARARFLADSSALLAESLDYKVTLAKMARLAVPFLADACTIDVVEDGVVRRIAGVHVNPLHQAALEQLAQRYPAGGDAPQPAAQVLRSGEPILLTVISDELMRGLTRDAEHFRLARAMGATSLVAVPLVVRGHMMGALTIITTKARRRYGLADLNTAQDLARRTALALDSARLYRESQAAVRRRDEFLALAAHELQTPLTSLQLAVQKTTRHQPGTFDALYDTFTTLGRETGHMSHLVGELLSVARIQSGRLALEPKDLDLAATVREVVDQFSLRLQLAGSALALQCPAPVVGHWDRRGVVDIAINLVDNAIKFGAGRPITVVVDGDELLARLIVSDQGIGIPAERLAHVFERFERAVAASDYAGLGLGLFIVQETVTAMGGTVRAESVPGTGTRLVVELPRRFTNRDSSRRRAP